MKKILFLFLLSFYVIIANAQSMSSLYEDILVKEFNDRKRYTNDTLFYSLGLSPDCEDKFLELYDLELNNSSIIDKIPNVDLSRPKSSLIVLRAPELDKEYIYIPVTYYGIVYLEGKDYTKMVNSGTNFYYFKYSKREKKYIFFKIKAIH